MMQLDAFDLDPRVVRARFDAARRSGRQNWLWPDVRIADWQAALLSIGATIRDVLTDRPAGDALHADPDALGWRPTRRGWGRCSVIGRNAA